MLLKESTPSESQADAYEPIDRGAHIVINAYHMDQRFRAPLIKTLLVVRCHFSSYASYWSLYSHHGQELESD